MKALLMLPLLALWLGSAPAHADGLADLKAALVRGAALTPLKATAETRLWRKLGEGKDAEEVNGQAGIAIEDSARGLSGTHSREQLARVERELQAKAKNPNSKTPTLAALGEFGPGELAAMVSAAAPLQRILERAEYKGERPESWQGTPARLLSFEMPLSTLSERERKYAKKFLAVFEVWIGADGRPLASRMKQTVSGRAFVVVSFDSVLEEDKVYGVAGERLLTLRHEERSSASGMGERDERKVLTTLQLLP
ncbi:MAG TPA: hypothetical protein VGC21_14095 [Telluria sp.]